MTAPNPSHEELLASIKVLEAQARMIKAQERKQEIHKILELMRQHGVEIADLGGAGVSVQPDRR